VSVNGELKVEERRKQLVEGFERLREESNARRVVVRIEFEVVRSVPYGCKVAVVGTGAALGDWDVSRAHRLTWSKGDTWKGTVELQADARQARDADELCVEYKYAIVPAGNNINSKHSAVQWEGQGNRELVVALATRQETVLAKDHWGVLGAVRPAAVYANNPDRLRPYRQRSFDAATVSSSAPAAGGGADEEQIVVRFGVDCRTAMGDFVYVCGSIPELGSWRKESAQRMAYVGDQSGGSTAARENEWAVEVRVPRTMVQFEYKYFVTRANGTRQWEVGYSTNRIGMPWLMLQDNKKSSTRRRRSVSEKGRRDTTTAMVRMEDRWEKHKVRLSIFYPTKEGERMFVTGDPPELGGWFMPGPVPMTLGDVEVLETDVKGRKWVLDVYLPFTAKRFDYRYVLVTEGGGTKWEREPNRKADFSTAVAINGGFELKDVNFVSGMQFDYVPEGLFVGPYPQSAEDVEALRMAGVTAVVNTQTDEDFRHRQINWPVLQDAYRDAGIKVLRIPIRDFDRESLRRELRHAAREVDALRRDNHQVFIHCTAGMGRAPALAVAFLVFHRGWQLHHAVDHVKAHRKVAAPNVPLLAEMIASGR